MGTGQASLKSIEQARIPWAVADAPAHLRNFFFYRETLILFLRPFN